MWANIRFLIVDDDPLMLRLMRRVVELVDGLKVAAVATNGHLALAAVHSGGIEAVIMDVEMPELDGIAALRRIRESQPDLPVMICSGSGDHVRELCLESGATAFCAKEDIRSGLAQMLDRIGFQHRT